MDVEFPFLWFKYYNPQDALAKGNTQLGHNKMH